MNADAGLALPPDLDLPLLYGIGPSMTDAQLERRVLREMPSIWNKNKRLFPFCARLKSIHDLLVERSPVTSRDFWRDQVGRAQEIRAQRLGELAQAIAADSGAAAIGAYSGNGLSLLLIIFIFTASVFEFMILFSISFFFRKQVFSRKIYSALRIYFNNFYQNFISLF